MAPRDRRPEQCDELRLTQSRSKDLSKGQLGMAPTPTRNGGRSPDTPSSGADSARLKQGCSAGKAPSVAPRPGTMACNRPGRRSLDSIHHAEKTKSTSHRLQVMRQSGATDFSSHSMLHMGLSTVDADYSSFRPKARTRPQASPTKKERAVQEKVETVQKVESSCSLQ